MAILDTDYLVVGAGAAGMAFADALVAASPAELVLVDKRRRPGGHWNDAYSFVRLHQPSAYYGVNSRILGSDSIDKTGPNAGLYERATGSEICSYFQQVLDEHLLPSGQVTFFGQSEYLGEEGGEHRFVSIPTDEVTTVRVRRKVVDATYLETPIPSTHTPPFAADPDAQLIPVNGLVSLSEPAGGYTIIGGGKTAMDACCWLLDNGVSPDAICWVRPRDSWLLDRAFQQPLDLVAWLMEGVSLGLEAASQAESIEDLFCRLEACGQLVRIDPTIEPDMYHCATVNTGELDALRQIERVIRQGKVRHLGNDRIALDGGEIKTDTGAIHVDCSAAGLRVAPARPIFESERITLQQIRTCQPTFNAALVGYVEAIGIDETDKNRLCPPNPYPDAATDWVWATAISQRAELAWQADSELADWLGRSRLNAACGIRDHMDDHRLREALNRYFTYVQPAIDKLETLRARANLDSGRG